MASQTNGQAERTLVLATDVCSYSIPVVNLAVKIAASSGIAVRGLFVEDQGLLELSGSPLSREVSLTTASARPGSHARMQRLQRTVWQQFEAALQREAQALQITWSCEYVRGQLEEVGLQGGDNTRLAILGKTGLHRVEDAPAGRQRKVLLVLDHAERQADVLEQLLSHFGDDPKQVTLLSADAEPPAAQALQARLQSSDADVVQLETGRDELLKWVRDNGSSFDFAILSLRETNEVLTPMLKALSCPVILVA